MKLPDAVRKQLRAGKAVELRLPVLVNKTKGANGAIKACPLKEDVAYPIENDEGTEMGEFTALVVAREGDEWLVLIRAGADVIRYPAKGGGYTTVPSLAMRRGDAAGPELPSVDEQTQSDISKEANERWADYMEKTRPKEVRERDQRILANKIHRVQKGLMKRGIDVAPQMIAYLESLEVCGDEQREAA